MNEENKNITEDLKELSKKSLIRIQYSCCGINSFVDDDEYVPIVSPSKVERAADAAAESDRKDC